MTNLNIVEALYCPYKDLASNLAKQIGLTAKNIDALNRLNLTTPIQLLRYKPISYTKRKFMPSPFDMNEGDFVILHLHVIDIQNHARSKGKPSVITCRYCPPGHNYLNVELVYFKSIPLFLTKIIKPNQKYWVAGKISQISRSKFYNNHTLGAAPSCHAKVSLLHPELLLSNSIDKFIPTKIQSQNSCSYINQIEYLSNTPHIQEEMLPTYGLTYGITNTMLRQLILNLLTLIKSHIAIITEYDLHRNQLPSIWVSLKTLHLPANLALLDRAQYRLGLDEMLAHKLFFANALKHNKHKNKIIASSQLQQSILDSIEIHPTPGQIEAIREIEHDQINSSKCMSRLLQGDVGCGKTLVALLTALNVIHAGMLNNQIQQVAVLVPMEILARQHYQLFENALSKHGFKVALLTSSIKPKEKLSIIEQLSSGQIHVVVGTQALLQPNIVFHNLVYAIIDEQQRFGVVQRMELIQKGAIDILMMTATPIPRTMQIAYQGNLDISIIKSKVANRKPIITNMQSKSHMSKVIEHMINYVSNGGKAYWICPLKEQKAAEDANDDLQNQDTGSKISKELVSAEERYQALLQYQTDQLKVHLLTSDTNSKDKAKIFDEFKHCTSQILVATTVIEVGVDVPSATLIVIEDAQQFGLSQLHQLRGRVGRGSDQSYCMLIYNYMRTSIEGRSKLQMLCTSQDGFEIADHDLLIRGAGEIAGLKQSGEDGFFFAKDIQNIQDVHVQENQNFAAASQNICVSKINDYAMISSLSDAQKRSHKFINLIFNLFIKLSANDGVIL